MRLHCVALRAINGLTGLCITKLDVLDGIKTLDICTGYELDGKVVDMLPVGADDVARCKPIYERVPGWSETLLASKLGMVYLKLRKITSNVLKHLCGVKIAIVSTGPERDETIVIGTPIFLVKANAKTTSRLGNHRFRPLFARILSKFCKALKTSIFFSAKRRQKSSSNMVFSRN